MQMLMALGRFTYWAAGIGVVAIAALRGSHEEWFVLRRGYHITSACFSGVLALVLLIVAGRWLRRTLVARKLGLRWAWGKAIVLQSTGARTVVMLTILITHSVASALVASDANWYCSPPRVIAVLNFIRWVGWNTLLLLMVIQGHGCVLIEDSQPQQPGRARRYPESVLLKGWLWHWPKLIVWAAATGAYCLCQALLQVYDSCFRCFRVQHIGVVGTLHSSAAVGGAPASAGGGFSSR